MTTKTKNGRRAPVAIMGGRSTRRRRLRERMDPFGAEPASEALPGEMLVLLSRLHRAEHPSVEDDTPSA